MFEVDYGSGSVLGMEGSDDVTLAGLELSQVLFGLVIYEDQQVKKIGVTGLKKKRSGRPGGVSGYLEPGIVS